jgi:hypothetical protein
MNEDKVLTVYPELQLTHKFLVRDKQMGVVVAREKAAEMVKQAEQALFDAVKTVAGELNITSTDWNFDFGTLKFNG